MKKTGIRNALVATVLIFCMILTGTGCSRQITSSDSNSSAQQTFDPLSYAGIDAKMREYTFGINEYMREHFEEATQKITNGTTLCGRQAECTYTISPDSKYEALQMEKTIDGGYQVDEYFNMGDSVFITRTTVYDDGNFDPVEKFYVYDAVLYKVDITNQTVTKIGVLSDPSIEDIKKDLDIYLSFDEIRSLYA